MPGNMVARLIFAYILLSINAFVTVAQIKPIGRASFYGKDFHGQKTASGEIFNMDSMTAAHRTLPFNTVVRVTSLENNKSVTVRINDRGPARRNRDIDLSKGAAAHLDFIEEGVIKVKMEILYLPPEEKSE